LRVHRARRSFPTRRSSDLRRELGSFCRVLADDLDTLARLHHKGVFIEELNRAGELVPKTAVVCDLSDWRRAVEEIPFPAVLKPRSEEHTSELQSRENLVCR